MGRHSSADVDDDVDEAAAASGSAVEHDTATTGRHSRVLPEVAPRPEPSPGTTPSPATTPSPDAAAEPDGGLDALDDLMAAEVEADDEPAARKPRPGRAETTLPAETTGEIPAARPPAPAPGAPVPVETAAETTARIAPTPGGGPAPVPSTVVEVSEPEAGSPVERAAQLEAAAPAEPGPEPNAQPQPDAQPDADAEDGSAELDPATGRPARRLRESRLAAPAVRSANASRADYGLIRADRSLRARCAAALLVPFVVYAAVLLIVGADGRHWLYWIAAPLIVAGVAVGSLLDQAHRKALDAAHERPAAEDLPERPVTE